MTRRDLALGLVLALVVAFPSLALHIAAPIALWTVAQPIVWAFAAGLGARPYLARRITRRTP